MKIAISSSAATRLLLCAITLVVLWLCPAQAQSDKPEDAIHIPSSGGEVVIATAAEKASAYEEEEFPNAVMSSTASTVD